MAGEMLQTGWSFNIHNDNFQHCSRQQLLKVNFFALW